MKYSYFLMLVIFIWTGCGNTHSDETTMPIKKDVTELVYASASIVPQSAYFCRPPTSGIIEQVYIEKGEEIREGQALFSIGASAMALNRLSNAELNLKEAKDNLYGGNSKLRSIDLELESVKEQNQIDLKNYQRRQRLWDQKIGSESELERALLTYQASTSRKNALQIEYEQTNRTFKNQYKKALDLVRTEKSLLNDFIVRSEIDGKVFSVLKQVGEFISPQEVFAEIGSSENFIIEMNIDEVDISKIGIGDTAIVQLEAFPDTVYTSTLSFISEMKDEITQTFMVEGTFVENPRKLYNGLAGEANILIERRENALLIPSDYLLNGNEVLTEDGTAKVKIGVKSLDYVEILDGLEPSTLLIKPEMQ